MLILGSYITNNMGLGGEIFSQIWNEFYDMLNKKYNKETYKKLIESLEGWYKEES